MAYIVPQSEIYLYSNIPMDKNYNITFSWVSRSEQETFFTVNTPSIYEQKSLSDYTYLRESRNTIRVEGNVKEYENVNYMMFMNRPLSGAHKNYSDKQYYAFVTARNYVNDVTTDLTYEIDEVQTWYFETNFQYKTLVERYTQLSDNIGENIVSEGIGDFDYKRVSTPEILSYEGSKAETMYTAMLLITQWGIKNSVGAFDFKKIYNVDYTGYYHCFLFSNAPAVIEKSKNNSLARGFQLTADLQNDGNADQIVTWLMFSVPHNFVAWDDDGNAVAYGEYIDNFVFTKLTNGNYKPKNNKCLTYPYTKFVIKTPDDTTLELRPDFFTKPENDVQYVAVDYSVSPIPSWSFTPCDYASHETNVSKTPNRDYCIDYNGTTQVPFSQDQASQWIRDNGSKTAIGVASGAIAGAALSFIPGVGIGLGAAAALGAATSAASYISDYASAVAKGSQQIASPNKANLALVNGYEYTYIEQLSYPQSVIEGIDDYFQKYGYKWNKALHIDKQECTYWTYIKTIDLILDKPTMPQDAMETIVKAHNDGITYWRATDYENVGNYARDNRS